jgi:hypothetical protein
MKMNQKNRDLKLKEVKRLEVNLGRKKTKNLQQRLATNKISIRT